MKVLVACEMSGRVRDAFIARGHDAISADLLPSLTPGPHHQGDVLEILDQGWDLMIAFPPCTHLAVSGAKWFEEKRRDGRQQQALEFVRVLLTAPISMIALENPVGVISTYIRKPDQIVQPYWFGDSARKTTCLWLKGLPKLTPTNMVDEGESVITSGGKRLPKWYNLPPSPDRALLRSMTFPGFALAMADQWG